MSRSLFVTLRKEKIPQERRRGRRRTTRQRRRPKKSLRSQVSFILLLFPSISHLTSSFLTFFYIRTQVYSYNPLACFFCDNNVMMLSLLEESFFILLKNPLLFVIYSCIENLEGEAFLRYDGVLFLSEE
jgi:hypothetical protein